MLKIKTGFLACSSQCVVWGPHPNLRTLGQARSSTYCIILSTSKPCSFTGLMDTNDIHRHSFSAPLDFEMGDTSFSSSLEAGCGSNVGDGLIKDEYYTVDYLIMHNTGPWIGLCISRSYAVLDMSHFVTSCDSPKKVTLWLMFEYLQITDLSTL